MDKFKYQLRRLLTPLAVLFLVAVMAIASPVASVIGALRVSAATVTPVNNIFDIKNLPARYAKVNETITAPDFANTTLWHANDEIKVAAKSSYTYGEVGQYEWRFYANADDKTTLFYTHTVWVTQPEYVITMPSVVPTVAPKDLDNGKLVLPFPEKLTADGEEITLDDKVDPEDEESANKYVLTARASLGTNDLTSQVVVSDENVTIDLGDSVDQRVGTLQVTYILQDKDGHQLTAKVLDDIEIKNINKDKVTFSSNPSAPSVQNLSFWQEITLTAPTANSAKFEDTTFNVEATTKIIGVKFHNGATQPSNWDKITTTDTTKVDADNVFSNDFVKIDGLKVTTKQFGWYKFQFETDTLFGNKSENKDETSGKYWSDAVNIKSDSRSPEFKFVDAYNFENQVNVGEKTLNGTPFADIEDKYSKRYSFSTNSTEPANDDQKIVVGKDMTLTLPAIFAVDNNTALDQLKMTITVSQVKDNNGEKVSDNLGSLYYNNSIHKDNPYDPSNTLKINFDKTTSSVNNDNYIHLTASKGLYMITLTIEDVAVEKYGNGDAVSSTSPRRTYQYMYFRFDDSCDMTKERYAPTINDFTVSDVYLWEGKTFDFAVPTYNDTYTPTSNLAMDYYLVNETSEQVFHLDNDNISAGRMYVDLADLMDDAAWTNFSANTNKVSIYAVARNFTALQNEIGARLGNENYANGIDYANLNFDQLKALYDDKESDDNSEKRTNGRAVKKVAFDMHAVAEGSTANTVTLAIEGTTHQAGEAVHITKAEADFGTGKVTDARISVEVYQIKEDGGRVAVNVVDGNADDANKNNNVAAVAFRRDKYAIENWYFTPRTAGMYQVVVTAKNNASNAIKTRVETIEVKHNGDLVPSSLAAQANVSGAPDTTLTVGTVGRVVVPNLRENGASKDMYTAKNRELYDADNNKVGNYTITVKGVCDPDCLTGDRFIPHQAGTYTFAIDYYLTNGTKLNKNSINYVIEVTSDGNDATSAIKMDSAYNDGITVGKLDNNGGTGTAESPKYAITLPQFMTANIGGTTNFIVPSDTLRDNLEPIAGAQTGDTWQYMYPAIAIPMPNLISGTNVEDVEITVQKSGYNDKLVSSKVALANGKNSVIEKIGSYYVFRPDGKFKNNEANFMANADDNSSAVYVVTYKTKSTSLTFNITIGDPVKGELTLADGFLTYDNGKKTIDRGTTPVIDKNSDGKRLVTINLKKVSYVGNSAFMAQIARGTAGDNVEVEGDHSNEFLWEKANVRVDFEGASYIATSGWSEENGNKDNDAMTYQFNVVESGTYTVTVSLYNPYVNQTVTETFEFTIDVTATNKNVNLSTVWGIILVILSVGLLAGVIFYFVKTARETRFLDNPKAPKAPKAKKEKPSKTVKDQKEDVK